MRALVVVAMAGCGFHGPSLTVIHDGDDDVAPDVSTDCSAWQARHFDPCAIPTPGPALELTAGQWIYDTTAGTLTDPMLMPVAHVAAMLPQQGQDAWLISALGLHVDAGASLRVIGSRPLVVAAWGDIAIDGAIDASTVTRNAVGSTVGAGSPFPGCILPGTGTDGPSGTGGGGGASFRGRGGGGAAGGVGETVTPPGGAGAPVQPAPTIVRAGCNGAKSGSDTSGTHSPGYAAGGNGGGAIQLTARGELGVSGQILVGGSGAFGVAVNTAAGGGGGGSGGFIGLDSPSIILIGAPVLAANGGAGSEGMPFTATMGAEGESGRADATRAVATDTPEACGTLGGSGGAGATPDGADVTVGDQCGGGGGGGGVGYILTWHATPAGNGTVSPPLQPGP